MSFSASDFLLKTPQGVSWFVNFDDDDQVHIGASQDCTEIIEANKRSQNSGGTGYSSDKTLRHAATIPVIVQMKWMTEHGVDIYSPDPGQQAKVRQLLNSNEYRYLKPYEWQI